eukprot:15080057-Alexandrium_andersonii.AAC.1
MSLRIAKHSSFEPRTFPEVAKADAILNMSSSWSVYVSAPSLRTASGIVRCKTAGSLQIGCLAHHGSSKDRSHQSSTMLSLKLPSM